MNKDVFDALVKLNKAAADLTGIKARNQTRWLALIEAQREAAIVIAQTQEALPAPAAEPAPAVRPLPNPTFNLRAML